MQNEKTMLYFFKALHVVGFVSWFAGLFYLVRMFVYHAEAGDQPQPEQDILKRQYNLMEWRVYRIICNPALWITWLAGLLMLALDLSGVDRRAYFVSGAPYWLTVKLVLLALLTAYHFWCRRVIIRLEQGSSRLSDWQFRLANEIPTFFLVAISFLTVYGKVGTLNYWHLILGMAIFSGLIYWGARAYKKRREKMAREQAK
jgi:putative membrane protein